MRATRYDAVRTMLRATFLFALVSVRAQPSSTFVEVVPTTGSTSSSNSIEVEDVEKRFTPELVSELKSLKDDVLLLYTEYSARSGAELKIFLRNLTKFGNETIGEVDSGILDKSPPSCRELLEKRLKKIEYDAHRAASFSAENHHKFFLGHMIVFRMHLNKSEEYITKCERAYNVCGIACETTPKLVRWRRKALEEIHRVRDDMQHSRRSFKDILTHAKRKLNNLKKQTRTKAQDAITSFQFCVNTD